MMLYVVKKIYIFILESKVDIFLFWNLRNSLKKLPTKRIENLSKKIGFFTFNCQEIKKKSR